MSRYRVRIGDDFEIDAVDIDPRVRLDAALREKTKHDEAATRSRVSVWILVALALALVVAGFMRLVDGDFRAVQAVWAVVAVPLGWIGRYYYAAKE